MKNAYSILTICPKTWLCQCVECNMCKQEIDKTLRCYDTKFTKITLHCNLYTKLNNRFIILITNLKRTLDFYALAFTWLKLFPHCNVHKRKIKT